MPDPLATVSTRRTPQSLRADSRQVPNSAGGYTFQVDDLTRLRRFLTLGVDGGTYYVGERELARENAPIVIDRAATHGSQLVDEIVAISEAGRAPRQNPCLFALAVCASVPGYTDERAVRTKALNALPRVARTGTHLFQFLSYAKQFRGWGRGLRRAVSGWYLDKSVEDAAYQAVKYRQRGGWSHRDVLRLAHPKPDSNARDQLFAWAVGGVIEDLDVPVIEGFERAQSASSAAEVKRIVESFPVSWEMIPDTFINDPGVWEALLAKGMPQTALMRQLPRLTRLGLLSPLGQWAKPVAAQLSDNTRLRKARVHPINVLVAARTYASGRSMRGESTWKPSRPIVDALDAAFYRAFETVEPANKRTLLALDVSGSMGLPPIGNLGITPREASAALALVTAATEPSYEIVGFTGGDYRRGQVHPLAISPRQRLDDVIKYTASLPFGGTDCAQPMLYAMALKLPIDTFVIYTDNETWAGQMHPHQALRKYRERMGIDAKLVVVGMTSTQFSIADPSDPGMLDIAGFDSAVPNLITDFSRGL